MSVPVRAAQYTPSILVPLLRLIAARVNHAYYLAIASVLLASFTDFHVYLRARARCALRHVSSRREAIFAPL